MTVPRWVRSVVWAVAAVAFALAGWLMLRDRPELLSDFCWPQYAVAVALVPCMLGLNVAEYRISARYLGLELAWHKALQINVLGSAANMLPLPGAMVVRTAGLASEGASKTSSAAITLVFAASWVAMSCLVSGAALLALDYTEYGAVLLAVGAAALATFCWLSVRRYRQRLKLASLALALKLGVVLLEATQLYFCFRAIGTPIGFDAALAIQVSAVTGSAFALVPAGLGIREGIGALLARLIGLGQARGFLAVALNRLASMAVLIPLSLYFSVARTSRPAR